MSGVKLKICGISRDIDAQYINGAMPDYAGFIIGYPKSRRNISEERAAELRALIDSRIKTVGVFVDHPVENIARLANSGVIDIIQLHGSEDGEYISELRSITDAQIWKSFIVKSARDVEAARSCVADMVLLDGGLGGGTAFDHTLLDGFDRDFILAGGLCAENIKDAVLALRPYAVDVSSGVETDFVKDEKKILAVAQILRKPF